MAKLLIVDDELDVREFAKNFFRKRGIDVLTASDGKEALNIISSDTPDLMLLDIRMSGINGMDVLKTLRAQGSQTKVIMISGLEDDAVVRDAVSLGVAGFIHKPLILEELEKFVLTELSPQP